MKKVLSTTAPNAVRFTQTAETQPTFRLRKFRCERRGYLSVFSVDGGDHPWEMIERGHAVAILPVDWKNREVYLVEMPRLPIAFSDPAVAAKLNDPTAEVSGDMEEILSLEVPAGMIDRGETPAEAALRELKEEVGMDLSPECLTEICCFFSSAGAMTETTRCYLADVPEGFKHAKPLGDGAEYITVWKMSFDEFFATLDAGHIRTSSAIILAQALRLRLSHQR